MFDLYQGWRQRDDLARSKTLEAWVTMPVGSADEKGTLVYALNGLFQKPPTAQQISAAQELYRTVIDLPDGLKIMTIHSFCQSVLARFPLEAGIAPDMKMLDEGLSARLVDEAANRVYKRAQQEVGSDLHRAIYNIARMMNHSQFMALFAGISKERESLRLCLDRYFDLNGVYAAMCADHNIDPAWDEHSYTQKICEEINIDGLRALVKAMIDYGTPATDHKNAQAMIPFLECQTAQDRVAFFESYKSVFFKQGGDLKKSIVTKNVIKNFPAAEDIIQGEADRLLGVKDQLLAIKNCQSTHDILTLGHAILNAYEALKIQHGALDFDDQILKTLHLLRQSPSWVMYKLDRGLDHLLVDEAQDTNPEQWEIIECLCQEFFQDKQSYAQRPRSVFVVGDEKQSIYGFQRAAPEKFQAMRSRLRGYVDAVGGIWSDIDMQMSFRTTPPVLQTVDCVFAYDVMRAGVSSTAIKHDAFRRKQAGLVELWPSEEEGENEYQNLDLWKASLTQIDIKPAYVRLAERVAARIKIEIENGHVLESYGRPIRAGDYMVLLRKRTAFVGALMRALKDQGVPVSGADRMVLSDQISVCDLLSLLRFVLLPEDDLSVCELLKSPLIGLSEQQVYDVACGRTSSVFGALNCDAFSQVYVYLQGLIQKAKLLRPYEFFVDVLSSPCPMHTGTGLAAFKNRLGADSVDPLYEFLSLAMDFEQSNVPTLQNFYQWFEQDKTEIKRDTETDENAVRIMTVHGSKGLQAPIVILPDTFKSARGAAIKDADKILWPHKTGLQAPIWARNKKQAHDNYTRFIQSQEHKNTEEDKRLLYVAMTRAEERLYVCGYTGKDKPRDDSWYFYIQNGMKNHPHCSEDDNGILRIAQARTGDPDKAITQDDVDNHTSAADLPSWIYDQARDEQQPPRPYAPSRLDDADLYEQAVHDGQEAYVVAGGQDLALLRGNITHKLLEILPNVPLEKRASSAQAIMQSYRADLPDAVCEDLLDEVMAVLNHPDYALFLMLVVWQKCP